MFISQFNWQHRFLIFRISIVYKMFNNSCENSEAKASSSAFIKNPTARLGSITRKENEIRKILELMPINKDQVLRLASQYKTRIQNFEACCRIEFGKDVSLEDRKIFTEWRLKHLNVMNSFCREVKYILEIAEEDDVFHHLDELIIELEKRKLEHQRREEELNRVSWTVYFKQFIIKSIFKMVQSD